MTAGTNEPKVCPPDVCPVKWLSGEHYSDCDHPWHLTQKSGLFAEPPAEPTRTETSDEQCTDCRTVHVGGSYEKFAEWSWHAPWWGEIAQTLPEMGAVRAAGLAWRYQQQKIDALEAELLRLREADIVRASDIARLTVERDAALGRADQYLKWYDETYAVFSAMERERDGLLRELARQAARATVENAHIARLKGDLAIAEAEIARRKTLDWCVLPSHYHRVGSPCPDAGEYGPEHEKRGDLLEIAMETRGCCDGWVPAARLIGNVRADELRDLVNDWARLTNLTREHAECIGELEYAEENRMLSAERTRLLGYLEEAAHAAACGKDPAQYLATAAPTTLRDRIAELETAIADLQSRELTDAEESWPLRDVLSRLADFADDRLTRGDYDGHGHESLRVCVDRARAILAARGSRS
jgi:hypothetical protein